jgi:hypothetical protein
MKKKHSNAKIMIISICLFFLLTVSALKPCTVAVISGKVTADGCPLLWKNRDTGQPNNKVVFIRGEKYSFLGVINSEDNDARSVWQGVNSRGFAIINSASNDLLPEKGIASENGILMRQALGICADVNEFEALLQSSNGKRRVAANYGVIDACGNACFFETSSHSYEKFDANDPETAPSGYILRTNFAFSAQEKNKGGGFIRFERISHIFEEWSPEKKINLQFILKKACRDLVNEKLHSFPLSLNPNPDVDSPRYIRTNDTINRISTISVSVFHGAPSIEKPYLATMWVMLGQPICSVALPLWAESKSVPSILGGPETAPMHDLSKKLILYLYHDQRGNMKQYMDLTRFSNHKDGGFLPLIFSIEDQVLDETDQKLKEWEANKPRQKELKTYMEKTAKKAFKALQDSFADILKETIPSG